MKKKVIYISLLTATLSGTRWTDFWKHVKVFVSVCRKSIKQLHDCLSSKNAECRIQTGTGDGGFQVQIEAKLSFSSAGPDIKHIEAGL